MSFTKATGCCCQEGSIATLYRLDSAGNLIWTVNHYVDWGPPTSKNSGIAGYSPQGRAGYVYVCDQDESGNSYQIGGATVPVDPVKTNPQAQIDSLRKYNSSGVKQWGWSNEPFGNTSGATRIGPQPLSYLRVTSGGTSIVSLLGAPFYTFWGIDNSGTQLWTQVYTSTQDWALLGAGTDYFISSASPGNLSTNVTAGATTNTGLNIGIFEAATGNWITTLSPYWRFKAGLLDSTVRTKYIGCIDRSDNIYTCFQTAWAEKDSGAAILQCCGNAATATSESFTWQVPCYYIRQPTQIETDGTYVMVSGNRAANTSWSATNPSYADTIFVTEIFDAATGAFVRVMFNRMTTPSVITRHDQAPIRIGGGFISYEPISIGANTPSAIWEIDPTGDLAETELAFWKGSTFCGRFAADGSSSWYSVPFCSNPLTDVRAGSPTGNPIPCSGTYTWTAQSSGGGFIWAAAPSNACMTGCYPPSPATLPTSISDTFTVTCQTGVKCTGDVTWVDQKDPGGSIPTGYPQSPGYLPTVGGYPYYASWATTGSTSNPDCSSPCFTFGPPSYRPPQIPLVPGTNSTTVRCE